MKSRKDIVKEWLGGYYEDLECKLEECVELYEKDIDFACETLFLFIEDTIIDFYKEIDKGE